MPSCRGSGDLVLLCQTGRFLGAGTQLANQRVGSGVLSQVERLPSGRRQRDHKGGKSAQAPGALGSRLANPRGGIPAGPSGHRRESLRRNRRRSPICSPGTWHVQPDEYADSWSSRSLVRRFLKLLPVAAMLSSTLLAVSIAGRGASSEAPAFLGGNRWGECQALCFSPRQSR